MEAFLTDLTGVMRSIFTSGDWVKIAVVILVAFIGAMAMNSYRQAAAMSLFAMFLLAAFTIIYCVATGTMPGELSSWTNQIQSGWNSLMSMTGSTIVGYFVMFMLVISLLFTMRRLFLR